MGRRYDPQRRQRIIDAAIRVVAARGIGALSHRAVAAEADVPLGSTTYHFATLDDLLVAALGQANEAWLVKLEDWERGMAPDASLAEELAAFIEEAADDRQQATLEYELYFAALRHERLRPIAADCLDRLTELFARRTGDLATARALTAMVDGMLSQQLVTGRGAEREPLRQQLAKVIGVESS